MTHEPQWHPIASIPIRGSASEAAERFRDDNFPRRRILWGSDGTFQFEDGFRVYRCVPRSHLGWDIERREMT